MAQDLTELLARARAGDETALSELLVHYEPRLRTAARVWLGPLLRPHLDTVDLVQSVHRVLMPGLRAGRFDFTDADQLVSLAVTILRRKIADNWRRLQKTMAEGEVSGAEPATNPDEDPARVAEWRDSLERFLGHVNDTERRLLELYLLGWRAADIAAELGTTDHVIRARMSKLRAKLADQGCPDWF